jgi:hypothetical protein
MASSSASAAAAPSPVFNLVDSSSSSSVGENFNIINIVLRDPFTGRVRKTAIFVGYNDSGKEVCRFPIDRSLVEGGDNDCFCCDDGKSSGEASA